MKKLIYVSLLCLLAFLFNAPLTKAHTLKTSGSVGAVMHVSPEDDPIAGEQSDFFFEFKDKNNKFKPENCDCTFAILQSEKEIYTQPLFANSTDPSLTNASVSFTFPQRDVYKIKIDGKPKSADFEAFTLEYDIRVSRVSESLQGQQGDTQTQPQENWFLSHIPHLIGGIVAFVVLGFVLVQANRKNKNE